MRRFSKTMSFIAVCALLGSTGCSTVFEKHIEYSIEEPDNYPILRAIGYAPISQQPGNNQEHQMIMAMKASKLDAYRELAEQVYGQKIDASTTLRGLVAQDDALVAKVNGMVRGAKVIKSYAVGDSYATELELDMKQVRDLYIHQVKPRRVKRVTYH